MSQPPKQKQLIVSTRKRPTKENMSQLVFADPEQRKCFGAIVTRRDSNRIAKLCDAINGAHHRREAEAVAAATEQLREQVAELEHRLNHLQTEHRQERADWETRQKLIFGELRTAARQFHAVAKTFAALTVTLEDAAQNSAPLSGGVTALFRRIAELEGQRVMSYLDRLGAAWNGIWDDEEND